MVIYILLTVLYFVIGIFSGLFYAIWFDRYSPSFTLWIISWPLMITGIVVVEIVEGITVVFERIDNLPKRFRTWWHN
jgi:ABC-type dipeptide/oligopeptide/nickel transport system permease component